MPTQLYLFDPKPYETGKRRSFQSTLNLLEFFKKKTIIDDLGLFVGKSALVGSILFGFTALTSYNVANGQIEEAVRTKREELKEEETEESIKERKRRSTKWISPTQFVRIYCHDNRIDTFTVLAQSN